MSKSRRLYAMLAVVLVVIGALTAALIWGSGANAVSAQATDVVGRKSVSAQEVAPGQEVSYTIVVTNTSGSALSNVEVSDRLHDDLTYVVDSDRYSPGGILASDSVFTNQYITFTIASIAADGVVTITFDATLDPDATPGATIGNSADLFVDGTAEGSTSTANFTVSPAPGVQIYSPNPDAVITQRPGSTMKVEGKTWTDFNPATFPEAPVLAPITYAGGVSDFQIDWSDSEDAESYVWYESRDVSFNSISASGTVVPPNSSTTMTGKAPGTYYYRVRAYRNGVSNPSRLSNIEGVTVATTGVQAFTPSVSSMAAVAQAEPAVEVNAGEGWESATVTQDSSGDWWNWSYDWTVPEGDGTQVSLQARAHFTGVTTDYATDAISVTLQNSETFIYLPIIFKRWPPIPFTPTMADISFVSGDLYRVSWTYSSESSSVPNPIDYQLQEATDPDFTQNVTDYTVTGTSRDFSNRAASAYYYKVRARNTHGYGGWSNVKSVSLGRIYNFTSGTEGWSIKRSDEGAGSQPLPEPIVRDGQLHHLVIGSFDYSILSPMEAAPSAPYTIRARADIADSVNINGELYTPKAEMGYGIIFGGNGGSPCPADRFDSGGCLEHYYRLVAAYDMGKGLFRWALHRIDREVDGSGEGPALIGWHDETGVSYDPRGWNEWKIEVNPSGSNNIKIYLNGTHVGSATDTTYINDPYFGTWLNTRTHGSVAVKWDWFEVR